MRQFKDTEGRPWDLRLTAATLARIKDQAGLDLLDLGAGREDDFGSLSRLMDEPLLLLDALWWTVQPQAEARQVDRAAFLDAINGDTFERAGDLFLRELFDFFPQSKRRLLHRLLDQAQQMEAAQLHQAETMLANLTSTPAAGGNSSGSSPDGSA